MIASHVISNLKNGLKQFGERPVKLMVNGKEYEIGGFTVASDPDGVIHALLICDAATINQFDAQLPPGVE